MTYTIMTRVTQFVVGSSLAVGLGFGCSSESTPSDSSVSSTFEALGAQLENCRSSAAACLKDANCDAAEDQACRDEFKACHDKNRAAFEAFGNAVDTCVQAKKTCNASASSAAGASMAPSAGTSGSARSACRQAFHECVDDAKPVRPAPNPCVASLRTCVQDSANKPMDCFDQARSCIMDQLPPCCAKRRGQAGAAGGPMTAGRGE